MHKKLAVCTAALVAAASVGVCCRPVPVSANSIDDYLTDAVQSVETTLQIYLDNIGADLETYYKSCYDAAVSQLSSINYAITQMALDNTDHIPASSVVSGWYQYRGNWYVGSVFLYDRSLSLQVSTTRLITFTCQHFYVCLTIPSEQLTGSTVVWSERAGGNFYGFWHSQDGTIVDWGGLESNVLNDVSFSNIRSYTAIPTTSLGADLTTLIETPGSCTSISSSGDYFPSAPLGRRSDIDQNLSVTSAPPEFSGNDYIGEIQQNIVDNYGIEVFEVVNVFPVQEPTEPPIYPTGEYVTGIPKDWTIENPQLPTTPQMNIEIPEASLPDLSGLSQYTDGVGFWWALTGHIMDVFGIRTIVLLLIGIGVFAFVIYRLGAG